MPDFVDINSLEVKESLDGSEKIQISKTQAVNLKSVIEKVVKTYMDENGSTNTGGGSDIELPEGYELFGVLEESETETTES